jgi:hypothetical protein
MLNHYIIGCFFTGRSPCITLMENYFCYFCNHRYEHTKKHTTRF